MPVPWYTWGMETIKKISDIDPGDRAAVERLLGQALPERGDALLILKTEVIVPPNPSEIGNGGVPAWYNVLDGFSDEDLAEFDALLNEPCSS